MRARHAALWILVVALGWGACFRDWERYAPRAGEGGTASAGGAGGVAGASAEGGAGTGGTGGDGGSGGSGGAHVPGELLCHVNTGTWTRGLAAYPDGGFLVSGSFSGTIDLGGGPLTSAGQGDPFVARFGPDCEHVFSVRMGSAEIYEDADAVAVAPDGGVVTVGGFGLTSDFGPFNATSAGVRDFFAAKLSATGTFEWVYALGGAGSEWGRALAVDASGNVYFGGTFEQTVTTPSGVFTASGGYDAMVVKLSAAGAHVWSLGFGGPSTERVRVMAIDPAGDLLIAGRYRNSMQIGTFSLSGVSDRDVYVAKLASAGGVVWARAISSPDASSNEYVTGMAVRPNGNIVITGRYQQSIDFGVGPFSAAGDFDVFVAELDPSGNTLWARSVGGIDEDRSGGIAVDGDGNIALGGAFHGLADFGAGPVSGGAPHSVFAAKLDPSGTLLWATPLGVTGSDYTRATTATVTSDGDVVIGGASSGSIDFGNGSRTAAGFVARFAR